jgi:hypothetical protein
MQNLFKSFVLATLLATFGSFAVAGVSPKSDREAIRVADKVCTTETVSEILEKNKEVIVRVHLITGTDLEKYLAFVNVERKKKGIWSLEADALVLAELTLGEVGMAMFKDKCLVPGTFAKDTVSGLRDWFKRAGVENLMEKLDIEALEKARLAKMTSA